MSVWGESPPLPPDGSRMLLGLEHALLGASNCESTLDIQLRDAESELCAPSVIYVDGAPVPVVGAAASL